MARETRAGSGRAVRRVAAEPIRWPRGNPRGKCKALESLDFCRWSGLAHELQSRFGMQLSAFNLYRQDFPAPGQTLIHNTFSGAYVILDAEERALLRRIDRQEGIAADEEAIVADREWLHPDIGILVADLDQEEAAYRAWFDAERNQRHLHCIVGVNLACNFECPYCLQADVLDGTVMKPAIAEACADWLAERARAIGATRVRLTFIGGEPLLHPERIKMVSSRLRQQLADSATEVRLGLITNGYFLTEDMVQELLPHGLDHAQVTLDGDHTSHCRSRVSKRGEDTFERIFSQTIAASRHIRIAIKGNYQEDTVHGFGPLVDRLAEADLPRGSVIQFAPALETLSAPAGTAGGACTWSEAAFDYRVALHDKIVGHGYSAHELHTVGPCGFHDHNTFAVDPAGHIYKCPGFLGHPTWRIGGVQDGLGERYRQMLAWNSHQECAGCAHRPNCAGGCVADVALARGQLAPSCDRHYLDSVQEHALPRQYLMLVADEPREAVHQFPEPPTALPLVAKKLATGVRSPSLRVLRSA